MGPVMVAGARLEEVMVDGQVRATQVRAIGWGQVWATGEGMPGCKGPRP